MRKKISASPKVGIIMGSDTDWSTMKGAVDALAEFNIPNEIRVISAHRTPHELSTYATSAYKRGSESLLLAPVARRICPA
jgi:5-(carboxyamino)imidazole ribonucleotide mutase